MTQKTLYKDPAQPIEKRIEDLLGRMTREEKVGQLVQLSGRNEPDKFFHEQKLGSFLHVLGDEAGHLIELARKSRLGIPLLLGVDAIHGHSFWDGATIFPVQLAVACSWNEEIIEEMGAVTAREMRHTGVCWTFSPVLCIARDLRWGRVGETFGEDPFLIGRFACAMIRGYQGKDASDPDRVMACAKHYAGYSETQGGRDASESDSSRRKLKSYFLPPFEKAAKAGVGSFMTGYQSMEGVPSTLNKWLLRDTLKNDWGFDGLLVTDWDNVGTLVTTQKVCPDYKRAAAAAIECGNDLIMSTPQFYQGCLDALQEGLLSEERLNEAVARVLRIKFRLGLFEDDRMPDEKMARKVTGCKAHRDAALRACRESAVLLTNNGILPLNEKALGKIAIIGPNADDQIAQGGDWNLGTGQNTRVPEHPRACTITVLDGIKKRFRGEVIYAKGCPGINSEQAFDLSEAIAAAKAADLSIVAVGDRTQYWGEGKSTATLELQGGQKELLAAVAATGKPYIIVNISSKVLVLPDDAREKASAIIQQFSPGMLGGQALAEILFGDINPCGRLTISMPYHVGQQPIFYNQVRGQHGNRYADMTQEPLFAFGHGLTYTTFEYETAKLDKQCYRANDDIRITVKVRNSGKREGTEVIQAYVSDLVTSATWVDQELKGFARVSLKAGESKDIEIIIPASECSIVNVAGERVVEPGDFELRIGMAANKIIHRLPFSIE